KTMDQPELAHQQESASDRRYISEIATRYDNEIRDLPAQLLDDLEANRFLAFHPKGIHGVREIDRRVLRDFLNDLHTAVKIRVDRNRDGIVRNRLNELRDGNPILRKKYDRWNAGSGAVGGQSSGCIARRGACDGTDTRADLIDHRDKNGHSEIFERSRMRRAA